MGSQGKQVEEPVGDMFARLSLSREDMQELYRFAKEQDIPLFVTPFDVDYIDDLEAWQNPIYKIASSDVCYVDMLHKIAETKKPVMLATGKSTLSEVNQALNILEENGTS